jgi:hypothetical protein
MLMDYGVSASTPWIVDHVSVKDKHSRFLSAQTPHEDQSLLLTFKSNHPDYEEICKLKPGAKVHFTPSNIRWTIDSEGEAYRLKKGWPRSYRMPPELAKLRQDIADEIGKHSEWCSATCETFIPGWYRGKRLLENMSREEVQNNYDLCHRSINK